MLFDMLASDSDRAAERAALDDSRGKMIGVLEGAAEDGTRVLLCGYSGTVEVMERSGRWVAPVRASSATAEVEQRSRARVASIEAALEGIDLSAAERALATAREAAAPLLAWRDDGSGDSALRRAARAQVREARDRLAALRERRLQLLSDRRAASLEWSEALEAATWLTSAGGLRLPLRALFAAHGIAGGTADCAVPRLLEAANQQRLRPVAIAEAWWGKAIGTRQHGALQPPCERKCLPLLGHLLCPVAP